MAQPRVIIGGCVPFLAAGSSKSGLAAVLVHTEVVVSLRGLRENQLRMLTYFGVEPSRFGIKKNNQAELSLARS